VGVLVADIDTAEIERTRARLPTRQQRRAITAPRIIRVAP
jgi:predicted amidohydrolase